MSLEFVEHHLGVFQVIVFLSLFNNTFIHIALNIFPCISLKITILAYSI